MMSENSRNVKPRDIVVLYNKLVCMADNKIACISKAHRDDICKKTVSVVKTNYISAHRFSCKVPIIFFFDFNWTFI